MATVTGVVEAKSNKFGKFSILLDNGTWYSSKYDINCEKGDAVTFEDGDRKYCQKLKVVGGGGGTPSASTGATSISKPAPFKAGFPVPIDTKDRSIVRQNALSHATNLFIGALSKQPDLEKVMTPKDLEKFLSANASAIVETARIFEGYTSGDDDAMEAEQILKETA